MHHGVGSFARQVASALEPSAVTRSGGIVIVTDEAPEAVHAWWARQIVPVWPDDAAPDCRVVLWDAVGNDAEASEILAHSDAAIVRVTCGRDESDVRRVCAVVGEHAGSGVCVLPASLAHAASAVRSMGLLVHHDGRSAGCLGSMLMGLTDRRAAARDMDLELRARRAAQNHVHSLVSKIDGELLLAAKLQREAMRSDELRAPGVRSAVLFRPAWYVSGDVYKLMRVDEQHVGFVLADAMGHGVSAAMYSMLIASATQLKTTAPGGYKLIETGDAMSRLNELLLQPESEQTRFASGVIARINTRTGDVAFCSAGHPTALIIGPDRIERLESTGTVLGVMEDALFDQISTHLAPGETLVVFTDGLDEVVDGRDPEAFLASIIRQAEGDPARAVAAIEHHIDTRPGSLTPVDDITIVMFSRT